METSILKSTKKILGLGSDYTAFDHDVITHINAVFSTLHQLGVGPAPGFAIEDDTANWDEFLLDHPMANTVKTYMYLRVRLLFDPPTTSFNLAAMEKQLAEIEWRLSVMREETGWVNPLPSSEPEVA